MKFRKLTSEDIRKICKQVDKDMCDRRAGKPRRKRFFDDWPSAQFTKEEIRMALDAAWEKEFPSK